MKNSVRLVTYSIIGLLSGGFVSASGSEEAKLLRFRGILDGGKPLEIRNLAGRDLPIKFIVSEGKAATEGTVLAELDASGFMQEREEKRILIETAKAEVIDAQADLDAAKAVTGAAAEVAEQEYAVAEGALKAFLSEHGEHSVQIRALEKEISLAEKTMALAANRIQRLKAMIAAGTTNDSPDEAELALLEATSKLEGARDRKRFLEEIVKPQRAAELALAIAWKKLELIQARNARAGAIRKGEKSLAAAQAGLRREEGGFKRLEDQIEACRIRSPREGVVAYPRETPGWEPGAVVRGSQVILELVDPKVFYLTVQVPLPVAQMVTTGQDVTIRLDAFADRPLRGHIVSVGVLSQMKPGQPLEAKIVARLDELRDGLKAGMTGSLELSPKPEIEPPAKD